MKGRAPGLAPSLTIYRTGVARVQGETYHNDLLQLFLVGIVDIFSNMARRQWRGHGLGIMEWNGMEFTLLSAQEDIKEGGVSVRRAESRLVGFQIPTFIFKKNILTNPPDL
jgi:hypothetical protein